MELSPIDEAPPWTLSLGESMGLRPLDETPP